MRNPAGLRRFPSPHTSLVFPEFLVKCLVSNEEGMWVKGLYRGAEPVARGRGATGPPCRSWVGSPSRPRGATAPLPPRAPSQGPLCKLEEKNYIKVLLPPGRATGIYFRNFSKQTYIFEILIFFKYKKEKSPK